MKQPTKKQLRDQINELVAELSIARSNELSAKLSLTKTSEELVYWRREASQINNHVLFTYKGDAYSFGSLDGAPLKIENLLQAIDEGRVAKLPEGTIKDVG